MQDVRMFFRRPGMLQFCCIVRDARWISVGTIALVGQLRGWKSPAVQLVESFAAMVSHAFA